MIKTIKEFLILESLSKPEDAFLYVDNIFNDINLGFTRSPSNDLSISEYDAVVSSMLNILTTRKGDRILSPNFGSRIHNFLFSDLTNENGDMLIEEITTSLTQEPRIKLNNILVFVDKQNSEFVIDIFFNIPSLDVYNKSVSVGVGSYGIRKI